jgi:hypothetical protein
MNPGNKNRDILAKLVKRFEGNIINKNLAPEVIEDTEDPDLQSYMSNQVLKPRIQKAHKSHNGPIINYPIAKHLVKTSVELQPIQKEHVAAVCIYAIKDIQGRKVVTYMLYKLQDLKDSLVFPFFKTNTVDDLETQNAQLLRGLNEKLTDKLDLVGFLQSNEKDVIYSFYEYSSGFDISEPYFWSCLTEMGNTKTIFDYSIHAVVSDLLIENDFLSKVYKSATSLYENPTVLYSNDENAHNLLSLSLNNNHSLNKNFHLYKDTVHKDTGHEKQVHKDTGHEKQVHKDTGHKDTVLRNIVFLDKLMIGKTNLGDFDENRFDSFHYRNSQNKITWHVKSENNIEQMKFL